MLEAAAVGGATLRTPDVPELIPDFFIAGAPRCGTTALFRYLQTHPGVDLSSQKEPFFWCTDIRVPKQVIASHAYSRLWDGATPTALKGEGTTGILRSAVAVPAIVAARPDARFIVMLRNPSEMAPAFHSHHVRVYEEDVGNFEAAWRLQADRRQGRRIPPGCVDDAHLQYQRVCALGDQLERFFAQVPEHRRLVILFDDFAADTAAVYRRVLDFLELPQDGRRSFERINANMKFRSVRLANFHRTMSQRLGSLYMPLRTLAASVGLSPSAVLNRVNRTTAPRAPLPPAFAAELAHSFLPQVEKLETLLERDLSHWKRPVGR